MQKITAYKLTDGSIIEDKGRALNRQLEITQKAELFEFCYQNLYDPGYRLALFTDSEDLAALLFEYRKDLIRILSQTIENVDAIATLQNDQP